MARIINRLSPRFVQTARPKPGQHATRYLDGAGLHLAVTLSNDGGINRSWSFKYELNGQRREIGMGPLYDVPLAVARERAKAFRDQLREGIDPLDAKRERERALVIARGKLVTFQQDAEAYIALHAAEWKSEVHAKQWPASLRAYVYPQIGDTPVSEITPAMIRQIIEPLWINKTETASRVLNRIHMVLAYATSHAHRQGDNPASNLLASLPRKSKVSKVEHFAAVPYAEIGDVMARLREIDTVGSKALRFLTFTATRSNEVFDATWAEIKGDVWTIPGERMKAGRPHRVPLSPAALAILETLPRNGDRVFAGLGPKRMRETLQRLPGRKAATTHGMRSAFKQWATEQTAAARAVIELSLAHAVALDPTESAYLRDADLLERRRVLMWQWAKFCTEPVAGDTVVMLRAPKQVSDR
jgi:integrase